ncbi:G patch domain and ankyrin repeat-containing protein 1 homolog [Clytia hemisphaerica]|uniref:G patch domain and ankyrin repeat-containing protein 1 homolog n=1 Tax=Clytia hemisphaerica TaxID=252671 RepID=UPI0034D4908C|eukprot:TCONS_00003794-protein
MDCESIVEVEQESNGDIITTDDLVTKYKGRFVKSRDHDINYQSTSSCLVTGDQAKSFYDTIINTTSSKRKDGKKKKRKRSSRNSKSVSESVPFSLDAVKKYVATLFCLCENRKNVKDLKSHLRALSTNRDFHKFINSSDQYGWSALMSASASNNLEAVKLLINYGARYRNLSDKAGNSVQDICKRNDALDVLNYLASLEEDSKRMIKNEFPNDEDGPNIPTNKSGSSRSGVRSDDCSISGTNTVNRSNSKHSSFSRNKKPSGNAPTDSCTFTRSSRTYTAINDSNERPCSSQDIDDVSTNSWSEAADIRMSSVSNNDEETCELCGVSFPTSFKKQHETSMTHLLKDTSKTLPDSSYTIPEHNVGFQMMLRTGWEQEGLGPDGAGRKKPIKTVLKLDKSGLGLHKTKERVSHFAAFEEKAIGKRTHDDIMKTERRKRKGKSGTDGNLSQWKQQKKKSRFWERDLRRYMSSND